MARPSPTGPGVGFGPVGGGTAERNKVLSAHHKEGRMTLNELVAWVEDHLDPSEEGVGVLPDLATVFADMLQTGVIVDEAGFRQWCALIRLAYRTVWPNARWFDDRSAVDAALRDGASPVFKGGEFPFLPKFTREELSLIIRCAAERTGNERALEELSRITGE